MLNTTRLRDGLLALGYTHDRALERIGDDGQAGLGRNVTVPADLALTTGDALDDAIRLWVLQRPVPAHRLAAHLELEDLAAAGLITRQGDNQLIAAADLRPYGSPDDGASGWLVSDLTPGLDHQPVRMRTDYVLGASPASTTLAQLTMRTPVGSALDLGTGCGIQSMHLARHADRVVATDLNPRALELARIGAELNQVDLDLRVGSLYEPVAGERFDLIVTNPPYVMSPPTTTRLTYREGSHVGDGLVRAVVEGAPAHLNPGGTLQVLGNWAITADQPWDERLASWAAPDHDLWVVERERLSVHEYIEMWLADAGVHQTPGWRDAYSDWLDYFAELGITGVGMGWLTLTAPNPTRDTPERRFEEWPWAVQQPVGAAIARHQRDLTASHLPWADLAARSLTLTDDIVEESVGAPGASGPDHIVLRQQSGLRRAIDAGTALAAVLGACDGDLALGTIIAAVANLLEVDVIDLTIELEPALREALRDGFLDV
ncbi:DUF7059 domain-containing protein [Propionibacteriaceae bacterium G1746]|uniref:DUF7059 domain-containing protein n=1 Tax=Aestuariimicrobium sp. G57 TaxID=3418485 RepID=UPI003C22D783